ncbi:MAG TPA: RDD family protein [Candidatus Kapabacteria bacterium]|nr:RDD family protein [Candidatus Kapabacteria bacterium]
MLSFTFQYGSIWRRAAAMAIDLVVLAVIGAVMFEPISDVLGITALHETAHHVPFSIDIIRAYGAWAVSMFFVSWLYFAIMESSRKQGTIGKRLMGLMVFRSDEARLSFREASIRFWAKVLSVMTGFLGFFLALAGNKRRTLHDRIAGTMVLQARPEAESSL